MKQKSHSVLQGCLIMPPSHYWAILKRTVWCAESHLSVHLLLSNPQAVVCSGMEGECQVSALTLDLLLILKCDFKLSSSSGYKHPTRSLWTFSGWGGGVLYLPRFIVQPPHVLFFHPKVSHHCYKLASRERYKLTNSKQPRHNSLKAARRTFQARNCYTLTLYDWQAKVEATSHSLPCSLGFPGPAPVLLVGLGHFSLGGLCLPVFWVESTSFITASG